MRLTARQIGHIVAGQVHGDATFDAYFSDSRKPVAGALFIALTGERFDGHDFVAQALAQGAGGALVALDVAAPEGACLIRVADTQAALSALGAACRSRHPGRFVALTGSVGKTTTKDMLAHALSAFGKVGKTPGNLNNHLGVPLTLLGLAGDEDFVVVELGMSAPGEIARLTHLARPDVGLVTRAEAAHLAFFEDIDGIAAAKAELYEHLPASAVAVVNADDPRLSARAASLLPRERIFTFGHDHSARVRVIGADQTSDELVATLAVGADTFVLRLAAHGVVLADNAAAALAACHALGLDLARAAAALAAGFTPARHRLERLRVGRLTVLDDCYNANPASARAALATFAELAREIPLADRLAVIGSMRELGPAADALHAEIGRLAGAAAALIVATGPHAEALAASAREAGAAALTAPDVAALAGAIADWARAHPDGAVLVKGSRSERLERVLTLLAPAASGGE
jgi:UDP-N-acetylmuramoyl-tripeptide--D-alanyl-D-alanine ligase